jgi:hypothetical protein
MYLRHTIRKKDGKVHRYWCLVRGVRVGGASSSRRLPNLASLMSEVGSRRERSPDI